MPGAEPSPGADLPGKRGMAWPAWLVRTRETTWRIAVSTLGSSMRYRVTGLAAEAAFFTVLSVPPLIFALAGAIGYVTQSFSPDQVDHVRTALLDLAGRFLTDSAVTRVIQPTIDDVLRGGRFDVISVGFVLSLWSGSRAMHVFVDTITIMHGLGGHRGIVKTRALSFSLYLLAIVTGVVALPLVVAGPSLVRHWLPDRAAFLVSFYWPTVLVFSICFLATLYHVSVPVRTRWRYNLPGAVFTMFCWVFGSALLRVVLVGTASGSTSIYGPLAAPIAVLLWLYLLSIAVLIGAALNAAFDQIWPQKELTTARMERLKRLKLENVLPWRNSLEAVAEEKDRSAKANDPAETEASPSGTSSGT
jgi:membrane protein